jgi:hypothetical protein
MMEENLFNPGFCFQLLAFSKGMLENIDHIGKFCRKKMSSLERDRQDLQSTIDALQEGKHAYMVFFADFYCLSFT